ncbi:MAG TPA: hypothetical protein DCF68_04495 [Cyanothece sp. UBA12306]|nr:hypothetical protein [Cyanothece sp. UBA12306]
MIAIFEKIQKNINWYLRHPHQGLYNKNIRGKIRGIFAKSTAEPIIKFIFYLDTLLLFIRVFFKRINLLGLGATIKLAVPDFSAKNNDKTSQKIKLLYFDLGTHKNADELYWMAHKILPSLGYQYQAYGFEAFPKFFEEAQKRFGEIGNVTFINKALCLSPPPNGKLKFYISPVGDGVGNSIYKDQFQNYEEVDAVKFSDWLRKEGINLEDSICLLRMNIEGAEFDVISDLIESELTQYIDGYFGSWDDVSKIDLQKDELFRSLLKANHIDKIPFHVGDIVSPFRCNAIKYHIITCVEYGRQKIINKNKE